MVGNIQVAERSFGEGIECSQGILHIRHIENTSRLEIEPPAILKEYTERPRTRTS